MAKLTGLFDAIMTPFDTKGQFNEGAFRELVDFQLAGGLHGLFVCGGGGEGLFMNVPERKQVAQAALDHAGSRCQIIVHVGALATRDCVELAKHAEDHGALAVGSLPPFTFAKDPDTIVAHFAQIVEAVTIPVLAYHLPGVTHVEIYAPLMERLHNEAGVAGIKFTDYNLHAMQQLMDCGPGDLELLYGRDEQLLGALVMGARGGIGSTYNVMPNLFGQLWREYADGQLAAAQATQRSINGVIGVLLRGGGIGACKAMLNMLGFDCGAPRSPSRALTPAAVGELRVALEAVGYFDLVKR